MLWIPRHPKDASDIAHLCEQINLSFYCLPVLIPTYFPPSSISPSTTRLIITSSHALRSCQTLWPQIASIPLYAVGEATAQRARTLGSQKVIAGPGNVHGLLEIIARQETQKQKIFYPRGREITLPLQGPLENQGHSVEELIVYQMDPITEISLEEVAFLQKTCHSVISLSPRMTKTLSTLAKIHGLPTEKWTLLGTSTSLAPILDDASHGPWKRVILFSKMTPSAIRPALEQL